MNISFDSAWEELTNPGIVHTISSLFELVGKVSGTVPDAAPGDIYLLWSGYMPDGETRTLDVAYKIFNTQSGGIHTIGESDVGWLLTREGRFEDILKETIAMEELGVSINNATPTQLEQIQARSTELLYGTDISGEHRISNASIWDFASHSYVAEAHGSFRIIAPQKLDDLSVFVQSELPALLGNPKISTIEGIPRTDLLNLKNTHGIETVKQLITSTSLNHVIYGGLSAAHIDDYLDILTPGKFDALAADKSKIAVLENYLTNHPDQRAYLNQAQEFINDIAKADSGFAVVFKKALGPVSIGLGLVLASWEAGAAELAGDHEGAKDRMIKWAVDAAGSEITQLAAGTLAAVGVAALIPAGIISVFARFRDSAWANDKAVCPPLYLPG